jgi:PAS domain S-box-containing protein
MDVAIRGGPPRALRSEAEVPRQSRCAIEESGANARPVAADEGDGHLLASMGNGIGLNQLSATYNYWLVALSFCVALLTSYTTVDIAPRVITNRGAARAIWLAGGAIAMGSGIWCMHYIGMLAYRLPIPVRYHVPTVAVSLLAAILASFTALYFVSREKMTRGHTVMGSLLMGAGIAAMHYIGMSAMRLAAMHQYDPRIWTLSIVLAVGISYVGLRLIFYLRDENRGFVLKATIAVILGLAIPIMHYTGMAAVSFRAMPGRPDFTDSVDISALAIFAIFSVNGLILGFALITSLIDRRIWGQHLLLEREQKMLRALIDHIPDCMYVKDAQGRFVLANIQLARTAGFEDPQLMIGKTDFELFPYDLAKKFHDDERRVMNSGWPLCDYEEEGLDADGARVPMLTTKVPLRDGKGLITGIAGVARDVSERKRHEEALRAAELKYRSMFDEALVGIFKLDPGGRLLQVNPAMAACMGYDSAEEMLVVMVEPLWAAAVSPERRAEFASLLAEQRHVRSFELEMFRKDRSRIWISSSVRAKYDNGQLSGFVGMFEDITERRVLREQLLQAQKLESVGQLAAGIAHEINTPVQYIGDNVRFLKDTFEELVSLNAAHGRLMAAVQANQLSPELVEEVAQAIEKVDVEYLLTEIPTAIEQTLEGVTRVSGLVSAMKEFSHPGTAEKVPTDLNHAIESTITVARNEWKYVADMKMELDADLPLVSCLPGEFNQVVLNMIVNAAHAIADVAAAGGPEKGLITIQTRSLPSAVEIRIQDTGGGIPEKVRSRIFDPFFTTKEIGKGTGQGLAIARSVVVDKHQGTIDFETEERQGTTFIIRLPLDAEQTRAQALVVA